MFGRPASTSRQGWRACGRRPFQDAYEGEHAPEHIRAYCAAHLSVESARETLSDPATVRRVAYREGAPVGFYVLRRADRPAPLDGKACELKQISVRAGDYGRGTGRALFDDALAAGAAMGRRQLRLIVSDRNGRARALSSMTGSHVFTDCALAFCFAARPFGSNGVIRAERAPAAATRRLPGRDAASRMPHFRLTAGRLERSMRARAAQPEDRP
ncbi:MAG: GNAT family N-acetyltransferase [Caulobacterales bacterium]|nr:GNAT family N-acetyltransferase [Caulobacterales bacterium]